MTLKLDVPDIWTLLRVSFASYSAFLRNLASLFLNMLTYSEEGLNTALVAY